MGLFDAIGKAVSESMANDGSLSKPVNAGFREGYDGPAQKAVSFADSGEVVSTYAGERMGDVCVRGKVSITYGCQKGTCGSCEVSLTADGQSSTIRVCQAIVPKDDSKSLVIKLESSANGLKRKLEWEQVKAKQESGPGGGTALERIRADAAAAASPAPPAAIPPPPVLPVGWSSSLDPASGKTFYFNDAGVTQWEAPSAAGAAPTAKPAPAVRTCTKCNTPSSGKFCVKCGSNMPEAAAV